MALVLMVARWIPNPKVRVRIFQAMPKLEVQFTASGEMVDVRDLKSIDRRSCGFDSHLADHNRMDDHKLTDVH